MTRARSKNLAKTETNKTNMDLLKKFIRKYSVPFLLIGTFFFFSMQAGFAQGGTRAGVFEVPEIRPGVQVEVPVEIRDVTDLYAFDVELNFDPEYLEFEDADAYKTGIQAGIGTFLDPGMMLTNQIDPDEGTIHVVMTQINPSQPKSGSGNLLVLYLTGLRTGQTTLEVTKVELSTRYGEAIQVSGVDAEIAIVSSAPVVTATSIPVIPPIEITEIPTLDPSRIPPTLTPMPTGTPMPTRTATPLATQTRTATATGIPVTATTQPTPTRTATVTMDANATAMPTGAVTATIQPTPTRTATATMAANATAMPTGAVTATTQPTQAGTNPPAPTVTQSQAVTQSAQPTSASQVEVGETPAAEPTGMNPELETQPAVIEQLGVDAEASGIDNNGSSEGRILTKDSPQSLGKVLPWLLGAVGFLIISAGIYLIIRKTRVIKEEDR